MSGNSDTLPNGNYLNRIYIEGTLCELHSPSGQVATLQLPAMITPRSAVELIINRCLETGIDHLTEDTVRQLYVEAKANAIENRTQTRWLKPANQEKAKGEGLQERTREHVIQKYRIKGQLYEAVLVGGAPFLLNIKAGEPILTDKIETAGMLLFPPNLSEYISKEYEFASLDEIREYIKKAQQESLDRLYQRLKGICKKYIDADDTTLTICAADIIFTYFQDNIGQTHYLVFVGDNGTGKTNILLVFQNTGYRAYHGTSLTPANIYTFYGGVQEGQGILLEDEADNIELDLDKIRICKVGYINGNKVSRIDLSRGRRQDSYHTFGFKAFCAERLPDKDKAKGFLERAFVIKCKAGQPQYDISEVINPAGDESHQRLLDELIDIRKVLLMFRMVNHDQRLPDIKLSIRNREKQLCKPLLRLFQSSSCRYEIDRALQDLLAARRQTKGDTLEGKLFEIAVRLTREFGLVIRNETFWERVKESIEGEEITNRKLSYNTVDHGILSFRKVNAILEEKFGAKKGHDGKDRVIRFSSENLERLRLVYEWPKIESLLPNDSNSSNDSGSTSNAEVSLETKNNAGSGPKSGFSREELVDSRLSVCEIRQPTGAEVKELQSKALETLVSLAEISCPFPRCNRKCKTVDEVINHAIVAHPGFPVVEAIAKKGINVSEI